MDEKQKAALDQLLYELGKVEKAVSEKQMWMGGPAGREILNRMDRAYGIFSRSVGR